MHGQTGSLPDNLTSMDRQATSVLSAKPIFGAFTASEHQLAPNPPTLANHGVRSGFPKILTHAAAGARFETGLAPTPRSRNISPVDSQPGFGRSPRPRLTAQNSAPRSCKTSPQAENGPQNDLNRHLLPKNLTRCPQFFLFRLTQRVKRLSRRPETAGHSASCILSPCLIAARRMDTHCERRHRPSTPVRAHRRGICPKHTVPNPLTFFPAAAHHAP